MKKYEFDDLTFYDLENSKVNDLYNDIFIDEWYCKDKFIEIEENDIVVDLGAHVGIFSAYAAIKTGNIVFAFEPSKRVFLYLLKGIEENQDKLSGKVFPINLGISFKNDTEAMHIGDYTGRDSCVSNDSRIDEEVILAQFITFRTMIQMFHKIDFLKIDIEGRENAIFIEENKDLFANVRKISLEYHDSCSNLPHEVINNFLKSLGFETKVYGSDYIGYIYAKR